MRLRQSVRIAAYRMASSALGAGHALRRRRSPDVWTARDPNRIHWVAPGTVVATTAERLDESLRGRSLGGDWDLAAIPLQTLTLWRGLEQRIVEGRDWDDTVLAPGSPIIGEGGAPNTGTRLSADDPAARAARLGRIDELIVSLRRDGWLAHHDVGAPFAREMSVAVGRTGQLVRNSGGLHRLIIAQLLGLDRIPCRVLVEHPDAPGPGLTRPGARPSP